MVVDGFNHLGPRTSARTGGDTPPDVSFGLCDSCRHQRIVRNTRGSVFSLCERSRTDPAFPRYPRMPVVACAGHEPAEAAGGERPRGPAPKPTGEG
jgi:hypothetical protein